jgi:NAD(P)-dependent dehydrogenase (short-subunit alcohol dehydrogenase family)
MAIDQHQPAVREFPGDERIGVSDFREQTSVVFIITPRAFFELLRLSSVACSLLSQSSMIPLLERAIDKGGFTEADVIAGEPVGRMGKPDEIAKGVLWLLSDQSSFVTGHPLTIDGGWVAR